jgi:hypothetical protein
MVRPLAFVPRLCRIDRVVAANAGLKRWPATGRHVGSRAGLPAFPGIKPTHVRTIILT